MHELEALDRYAKRSGGAAFDHRREACSQPTPAVCPLGEMLTTVLKPLRSIVQRG
jgi:hypothetical protein